MTNQPFDFVECSKCGWVHFAVSEAYVQQWEKDWEAYWPTLDEQGRENFGLPDGPPTRHGYLHCFRCGASHKQMKRGDSKGISGRGHTIQPILWEGDGDK